MPTQTENTYSNTIILAALRLKYLPPPCQKATPHTPNPTPHFTPQIGSFFPTMEMYKWTPARASNHAGSDATKAPQAHPSARKLFTGLAIPALAANPATVNHATAAMLTPAATNTHHSR
jgi:hypothetical protein